jgi:ribosome-associated toxin RatA of RatAB toxin-antitoxin module
MDVYEIVNDVERYPEFLPWCDSVDVLEHAEKSMVARICLKTRSLTHQFTTRNEIDPGNSIVLSLVEGPFSSFEAAWKFSGIGEAQGCRVELHMEFAFNGAKALLARSFSKVFTSAADTMVDAFCERAHNLHRKSEG